ncbi:MAG: WecB/TagA/CpsF family glycosyltransferase [Alteromonadaceae bacterium]|nr:WecB/TagA/CpsF family glycosyltransferase [Alteromonadaceae bacterium]
MKDLRHFNITPFSSISDTLLYIKQSYTTQGAYHIITANPEIVYEAVINKDYNNIFKQVELVVADGIGVALPLSWKGAESQRIPGIELFEALLHDEQLGGNGVYLVGAKADVVAKSANNLIDKGVNVCGYRDGFFSLELETIQDIAIEIKKHKPSIIAVAMGAPRQDIVISLLRKEGVNAIFIGVGGAFDVLSGNLKRAPILIQKLKIEWLYRLLGDLRRLPRYKKIFNYFVWLFKE